MQYYNISISVGITKSENFTDVQNEIALLSKALGHPARIAILEYLNGVDNCICGDIVNEIPLAQPTVSQHLKELKNANLIKGTIEGNSICYCINGNSIEKLIFYFSKLASKSKNSTCC